MFTLLQIQRTTVERREALSSVAQISATTEAFLRWGKNFARNVWNLDLEF